MTSTVEQFADSQMKLLAAYGSHATSRFAELPNLGLRAHCLECGSGNPVVMLHGGNSFAASWAPLVRPLSEQFRLYLPDRPGCGLTDKLNYRGMPFRDHAVGFMRDIIDHLGLQRTSLIGNSMGSYFAFAFALAYPERVDKIAVLGATPLINEAMPLPHRMLSVPGLNRVIWSRISKRKSPPRALYAQPDRLRPELLECARIGAGLPGATESWLTMVEEVGSILGFRARYNLKGEIQNLKAPSLFIQGDRDGFGSVLSVEAVQRRVPNSRLEIVKNAGHVPWYDNTERCAGLLVDFLRA